jgi:hypothetical protein
MGAAGDWTLVRRTAADTDTFFHEMAAFSLARELTTAIVGTAAVALSEPAEDAAALASTRPTDIAPTIAHTITVTTVPSTVKPGPADIDAGALDASLNAVASPVERVKVDYVMSELNSVAVWADPQRHDPSHVDAEMVTPTVSRSKKRWNGTRVS